MTTFLNQKTLFHHYNVLLSSARTSEQEAL